MAKICQRIFGKSSDVKRHCLTHTGEKPYVCRICEKGFRLKHHLKGHMLVHAYRWYTGVWIFRGNYRDLYTVQSFITHLIITLICCGSQIVSMEFYKEYNYFVNFHGHNLICCGFQIVFMEFYNRLHFVFPDLLWLRITFFCKIPWKQFGSHSKSGNTKGCNLL